MRLELKDGTSLHYHGKITDIRASFSSFEELHTFYQKCTKDNISLIHIYDETETVVSTYRNRVFGSIKVEQGPDSPTFSVILSFNPPPAPIPSGNDDEILELQNQIQSLNVQLLNQSNRINELELKSQAYDIIVNG